MKMNFSVSVLEHVSKKLIVGLFAGLLMIIPASAMAQKDGVAVPKLAVLDMQQLLGESKAGQSIRDQVEKQRNKYQKSIKKHEDDLRGSEKELSKQRQILSKEAFSEKAKDFQKDILDAQKDVNSKKYKLDKAFSEAMGKLREKIIKITAEIAAKEGYDAVLSRQAVVIVSKEVDITADVLKKLNAQVKTISVKTK